MGALAQRFGLSRKTAYKWIARYAQFGSSGLEDRSRAPKTPPRLPAELAQSIIALRHTHPTWGARKLRTLLARQLAPAAAPCERTIARYLACSGLQRRRVHRARPGPTIYRPALHIPLRPNDVWTVDFKGAFRTADGQRCEPLTVRDLFSRMVLAIEILPNLRHATLRAAFQRLFKRYGLPATIRVDHGQPFASAAPYGCTALSLWWMRLGIRVDFTRRAKPQDNGSHEQFHRVYKAETLHPPARSRRAQQRRNHHWQHHYNTERPHEALGQRPPAGSYRHSPRRYRPLPKRFPYPNSCKVYRVGHKGTIRWRGRVRLLSRILAHERVALRPTSPTTADVYLEKILLGSLHLHDLAGMRPVILRSQKL
jgi:transposase InsO family protein